MISSVRCDPKVFFEAIEERKQIKMDENEELDSVQNSLNKNNNNEYIEEFKNITDEVMVSERNMVNTNDGYNKNKCELPFYSNISTQLIVTHGIEVKGIVAAPINRKGMAQDLKLESYEFIANEENDAIEGVERQQLMEYIKV